jgi:hypothetical protein
MVCVTEFQIGVNELALVLFEDLRRDLWHKLDGDQRRFLADVIRSLRRNVRSLSVNARPGFASMFVYRDYIPPSF